MPRQALHEDNTYHCNDWNQKVSHYAAEDSIESEADEQPDELQGTVGVSLVAGAMSGEH